MAAAHQRAYVARQKEIDPEGWRQRNTAANREWRRRNPEKMSAHNKVTRALRKGALERPAFCERCDKGCTPEASHDDYSKPLEVEWLCRQCHAAKDWGRR